MLEPFSDEFLISFDSEFLLQLGIALVGNL
jgi:hypothetical protein